MLVINESEQPEALVFWLHGLGADCHDFVPVINALDLKNFEFILPNAPIRPITLNGGMLMRGWYDIESLNIETHDTVGLEFSKSMLEDIIKKKINSKKSCPKIFIVGFSQDAALALYLSEFSHYNFSGVIALSGYLPMYNKKKYDRSSLYAIHGTHDDVINIALAKKSYSELIDNGSLKYFEFSMAHEVIEKEIFLIKDILMSECVS